MLKVRNMESSRGREVPNQFIIENNGNVYFQSYQSVCAKYNRKTKKLTIGCDWDYSMTTRKYLYKFIKEETPISLDRNQLLKIQDKKRMKLFNVECIYNKNMV
nr:MAG TPA: hypothetical protein [Caudoviricetes sp.]